MNAADCSIVYLFPFVPFVIEDSKNQHLLESVFGQVHVEHSTAEAIEKVKEISKNNHPTLFLIDLDAIKNEEGQVTLSSCSTFTETKAALVRKILRDLSENIPLIVCSRDKNTSSMLDCIRAGAVDYLIKPFHIDVIKTLFLKLHQNSSKMSHSPVYRRMKEMTLYNVAKIVTNSYAAPQYTHQYKPVSKKKSSKLQSKLYSWDFSPFDLSQQELIHTVYLIFDQLLSLPELKHLSSLRQDQLYGFITELSTVYHNDNSYHNFSHAVDVLQCLFCMLCETGVLPFTNKKSDITRPQGMLLLTDVFALLMAAIGHDAAHPGVNNIFLVGTSNPLAVLYNDQSVLENLHSITLFQLLNKHGIDGLIGDSFQDFKKIVISSILATDMALHADYVEKIKKQSKRLLSIDPSTLDSATREKERILLCIALLKCADISNVARSFPISQRWAKLLISELTAQKELEKELNVFVTPLNDCEKIALEDSQIGFIRFVALDLFKSVNQVIKEISFTVDQLNLNLERWESFKPTGTKRSLCVDEGYPETKRTSLGKCNVPLITMTTVNTDEPTGNRPYCQCSIQ